MSGPRITDAAVGTVARLRVERGATTEFPVAEKVRGGWQTGVHHYPDESVAEVLGIYIHQPREVHENVLVSATEEAIGRYDGDVDAETGASIDDWGYSECQRQAFVAGALFAATLPHIERPVIQRLIEKYEDQARQYGDGLNFPNAGDWLRAELEGGGRG